MKLNCLGSIALAIFCGVLGCANPKTISYEELKMFPLDPDNGLIKEVEKGDIHLQIYYKPKDLIIRQQLLNNVDPVAEGDLRRRLDGIDYFVMRLSRNGHEIENEYAADPERFNQAIKYLSFEISKDLKLISKKDTLPVIDVGYAQTFNTDKATSVMAIFKSNIARRTGKFNVLFDDSFFGTGLTVFDFDCKKIHGIPQIKLN